MTATIEQARDDILQLFTDEWTTNVLSAGLPVKYDDVKGEKPESVDSNGNPLSWVRVTVKHSTGTQAGFTGPGSKKRFTRTGRVIVQLFTPLATGQVLADRLSRVVWATFAGKSTPNGVWFRSVVVSEVGKDGVWFQTNIVAAFTYDEQL